MELKAKYEANLRVEIPGGIHVESRLEPEGVPSRPNVLRIWSTSTVSSEDAIAKINLMMRALERALTASGNDV